jgi:hypothetical protein
VEILINAAEALGRSVQFTIPDYRGCARANFRNPQGTRHRIRRQTHFQSPSRETEPRIPEPYASNVFYYALYDCLASAAAGKSWKFCKTRSNIIIGFVPQNNAMNSA